MIQLLEACHQQRIVRIDYTSNNSGRNWRLLHPYGLDVDGRNWYVHGWCLQNSTIRTFHLANLHCLEATDERFERDEAAWSAFKRSGGIFRQWRGGDRVTLKVEFSPEAAPYARRTAWPEGLQLTDTEAGGILMTGEARGIEGVVPELLRWRRHVRVLGGAELKEAYLGELRAMSALYEESARG